MGLLQVAVLGPPEVLHNGNRLTFSLRKAQALLLYLSIEGGLHARGKLAAFLWPDSEPQVARKALRNVIMLLRGLLAHSDSPSPLSDHLLSQGDLIGVASHQLTLDHVVVLHIYQRVQLFSPLPPLEHRTSLTADVEHALFLVRGPVLDGFWLGEHAPFDEWLLQQQQQWQVRLHLLYDRLSLWQSASGESERARMTLTRWLTLNPLHEEAYRRLMQAHLALGDPEAALQVYATCKVRLAEELQVQPSAETVELAEHVRTLMLHRHEHTVPIPSTGPPRALLISPLIGRASAFSLLVDCYQDARQGQPQGVIIAGEAGIGKTRLVSEFITWARAQRADALIGHVLENGVRLPYQPLIEAIRSRLEEENAPDNLLDDLWLVELSRVLPELRIRYPDLPTPSNDELTDQLRFFEAVARLFAALARRRPIILFLDDVQWLDSASSDLLHYLAHHWKEHNTPILQLYTVRSEGLAMDLQLSARLADARRILPFIEITLQPLSQQEVLDLTEAIIDEVVDDLGRKRQPSQHTPTWSNAAEGIVAAPQNSLLHLARLLFEQTGGQPLYLMETFKLLLDRKHLVPKLSADGTVWRFILTMQIPESFTQKQVLHELLAPSIRTMILARLSTVSVSTRQLMMSAAVLGNLATAKHLWWVADLSYPTNLEALEEAVKSGLLREKEPWRGGMGSYRFAHELERDVIYTEIGEARRYFLHLRALKTLTDSGASAAELAYHANEAGEIETAYRYIIQAGDEALIVFAVKDAIVYYEQARALLHQQIAQTMVDPFPKMDSSRVTTQHRDDQAKKYFSQFPLVEHFYTSLSQAYNFQQQREQAMEVYEELLTYARQQQNFPLVSDILNRMAMIIIHNHTIEPRAEALMQEAVLVANRSGDEWVQAITTLNLAQIAFLKDHMKSALLYAKQALVLAHSKDDRELEAKSLHLLGFFSLWQGDFREAMDAFEAALKLYAILSSDPNVPRTYSILLFLAVGAPSPTHFLRDLATEAMCWGHLALAQLHTGQLHQSLFNGHRPVEIFKESRTAWAQFDSSTWLTYALLEAGSYQEALALIQQTIKLMKIDSNTLHGQIHLSNLRFALASTYQAMQQWEQARTIFEETFATTGGVISTWLYIPPFSRLCMHYALRGEWEQAYQYAMKAIMLRKHSEVLFVPLDFFRPSEIEALLRMGEEALAREEVQQMGKHLETYRRFRIPYLRSLAVLARWNGQSQQAIDYLRQASHVAIDLGLPAECWQIQANLGEIYSTSGQQAQANAAFREAVDLLQSLAQGIEDEAQRALFLREPFIQQILQHA